MSLILPSYKSGFYSPQRGGVAKHPSLWASRVLSFAPMLGATGHIGSDTNRSPDLTLTNVSAADFEYNDSYGGHNFDGTAYASTTTAIPITKEFTALVWLYGKPGAASVPFGSVNSGFNRASFYIRVTAGSGFTTSSGGFSEVDSVGPNGFAANAWHCVGLRYDGATLEYWLNGALKFSASHTATPTSQSLPVSLARPGAYDGQYFAGPIAEAMIYTRAITLNEIKLLASRPGIAYERKRSVFYSVPAAAAATTTGGMAIVKDNTKPSYKSGFYSPQRGGIPAYPELWRNRLFSTGPVLGHAGLTLRDDMGQVVFNRNQSPAPEIKEGVPAHYFDGNNDYYTSTVNTIAQVTQDFSISCWVYAQTPIASTIGVIASHYSSPGAGWLLFVDTSAGTVGMDLRNTGGYQNTGDSTTDIRDGWHHIAGVKRGTSFTLWIDGSREVNATLSSDASCATTADPLYIGRISGGTPREYKGWIAEFAIINRPITPNEIKLLATRPGIAYERKRRVFYSSPAAAATRTYNVFRPLILRASR